MLRIGLTLATLINMPLEANVSYSRKPRSKIVELETTSGDINVTATGRTRAELTMEFDSLELSEYTQIQQYCLPYVVDRFYVQILNTIGTLIFDGFAYIIIDSEDIAFDANKYSFKITIKST
ncbi:MAG: hypothetical protein SGJ02_11725 [bacterium]|nr:hypothetical protein [bacterium]